MKKEYSIIIAVIGGLILLGLGFYLGMDWAQKEVEKAQLESPLADLLASKVIGELTTVASGEITEISGRNLTLSAEGDTLTILIKEDATIARLVPPEEVTEVPQPVVREEIEFGEIKVGDRVNISCELQIDGSLRGIDITVLP